MEKDEVVVLLLLLLLLVQLGLLLFPGEGERKPERKLPFRDVVFLVEEFPKGEKVRDWAKKYIGGRSGMEFKSFEENF